MPEKWKDIFVQYTQDSSLHGVRYTTLSTTKIRRVIWVLVVISCVTVFICLAIDRLLYMLSKPKAVSVEVSFTEQMEFPAVTICNQNLFRVTALQKLGLYDLFEEKISKGNHRPIDINQTAQGACTDDFYRVTDGCLLPEEFWDYKTHVFKEITLGVCRHLCLDVHKDECSLIQYSGKHRICILTQNRALPPQTSCEKVIRMRRTRCPDTGRFDCDFEEFTDCPFLKDDDDAREIGPHWHGTNSGDTFSRKDHTAASSEGHQASLFTGDLPGPYVMSTPLLNTTEMCLEFHHLSSPAAEGKIVGTLTLSVTDEDLRRTELYFSAHVSTWTRALVALPPGLHSISITAHGLKADFAVDDITSMPCDAFDEDVLRHQTGQGYSGTRAVSASGKTCRPWIDQLGEGVTHVPNGGAPIQENYCRNVFLSPEGPGCFTEPDEQYENCDIPFRACRDHEFTCTSGQCISQDLICDLNEDCLDGSDEETVCAYQRSIECVFDNFIRCGYVVSDKSSPGHVWSEEAGQIKEFIPPNSHKTTTKTFLRLESFLGNLGDKSWLISPERTFDEESCLEFLVQLMFVEGFQGLPSIRVLRFKGDMNIESNDMTPLFHYAGHLDSRWRRVKIDVPTGRYRLVFEFATDGEDASITDIQIKPGQCVGFSHLSNGTVYNQSTVETLTYHSDNHFYNLESEWMSQIVKAPEAVRTEDGDSCSLPFIYQGVSYDTCIPDPQAMGKLWCSTTPNYDADKQRKFCFQGHYIETVNGTGGGRPCKFPFTWDSQTFYGCVSDGSQNYYWCVVDDADNWGHCIIEEAMTFYVPNDGHSWRSGWCQDTYNYHGRNYAGCQTFEGLGEKSCGADPRAAATGACLESCGGYFRSKEGTLNSPQYLGKFGDYPMNAKCSYWIEQPPGTRIKLEFLNFDIEFATACNYDYLEIFDGLSYFNTRLATFCGDARPEPIITPRNMAYLQFVSDHSINGRGFSIKYTTIIDLSSEEIGDVLKFSLPAIELKHPVKFALLAHTFPNLTTISCVYVIVSAKPSIKLELRSSDLDTVHKSVNFTRVSSELTDREVRWTVQPGTYNLYLIAVRSKAVEVGADALVKQVQLIPGDCADTVLSGGTLDCNFFSDGSCGYLDTSPGPAHFILDHHKSGISMVARIPTGTIGARLALISQHTTVTRRTSVTVTYEFINWDVNSAYNKHVISLRNMANDSYELSRATVKDGGDEWSWASCVMVEPGELRLEISVSSATAGEFAVAEVSVSKGVCGSENEKINGTNTGYSGDIWCDFEDSSKFVCPFRPSASAAGGETWIITEAKLSKVDTDHTTDSGTGAHFHLFPTFPVDNDTHSLSTDLWKSTGKCLQFWYRTTNMQPCLISVRAEDPLSESEPRFLYQKNVTAEDWMRVFVELPSGSHKIHIQGVRHSDRSGIAVDDIILRDCRDFSESRLTEKGIEYMGSMNISAGGDACIPWDKAGAVGSIPWGGAALAGHNHCRNFLLLDEGPGCFTDMRGTYQMCNISYEACRPGYNRCNSGRCLPPSRLCDGEINCLDGSDELCFNVEVFTGDWSGFTVSPLSAEYIKWNKTDSALEFDSSEANIGDKLWLVGPFQTYATGCLSIKLKMPPNPLYPSLPSLKIIASTTELNSITSVLAAAPLAQYSSIPNEQMQTLEVPITSGSFRIVYQFTMGAGTVILNNVDFATGTCNGAATIAGSSTGTNSKVWSNSQFFDWNEGWTTLGLVDDCTSSGMDAEYVGVDSVTATGRHCQPWTADTPHIKAGHYAILSREDDGSFLELDNKCMKRDEAKPWCYTMDPNERWEYCNIPLCTPMGTDSSQCVYSNYGGHFRSSCLFTEGYPLWCYTSEDLATWKYCSLKGRGRQIRTLVTDDSLGEACNLPFRYNKQTYHTCEKLDDNDFKCGIGDPNQAAARFGICVNDCGGYITQKNGYLVSPTLYGQSPGSPYPNNAACVYQIEQPVGHRINLTFISYEVFNDSSECNDYIEIRDGLDPTASLLYNSCNSKLPDVITSTGNRIYVLFLSKENMNYTGFIMKYHGYLHDNSLPTYLQTESYLSAEYQMIGYDVAVNNRWSVKELINLTVPEEGSCIDIELTFVGKVEMFYLKAGKRQFLVCEESNNYRTFRQELNIKNTGQYQVFLHTSYLKSTRIGASVLVKRLTIGQGICSSGYEMVLGTEAISGGAANLFQKTYSPSVDSCLIVPYVYRIMIYFTRMPVYNLQITNYNVTLVQEDLNDIFNRTKRIKGELQVLLKAGTYTIGIVGRASSKVQIGIGEVILQNGTCPEHVSFCTSDTYGGGYTGTEDRTAAGQPCANGTGVGYNTCSNPDNTRRSELWCYLEKDPTTFEFCDVPVCSTVPIRDGSCRIDLDGELYDGPTNKSAGGKDCMRWDGLPVNHTQAWLITEEYFPEAHISMAHNFCRNPGGDRDMPWCFIDPEYEQEQNCWIPYCYNSPYKNCLASETSYTGQWAKTRANVECQRWDSNIPHVHSYSATLFPELSLSLAENYCRIIDEGSPWCYTTDPQNRWDFCDIPACPSIYTRDGQLCSFPFIYQGMSYAGCIRNNNDDQQFWCSLTPNFDNEGKWGYCKEQTDASLIIEAAVAPDEINSDGTTESPVRPFSTGDPPTVADYQESVPESLVRHPDQNAFGGEYLEDLGLLNNVSLLYELSGHQLHDAIVSCWWNGGSCYQHMSSSLTDSGLCIAFNQNRGAVLTTAKTGATFGLRLTLDTQQYEYMLGPNTDAGVKVYLHDQNDEPMVRNLGFAISTGLHGLVAAKLSVFETLAQPWGACITNEDLEPQFGANYSLSRCNRWCETQFTNNRCGCIDAYMPDQGQYQFCNMTSFLNCLIPLTYQSGVLEDCNFECPDQCNKSTYSAELSYSALSGNSIQHELTNNNGGEIERFAYAQEIKQRVTDTKFSSTISLLQQAAETYNVLLSGALEAAVKALEQTGQALEQIIGLIDIDILQTVDNSLKLMKNSYKLTLQPLFDRSLQSLQDLSEAMTLISVRYQDESMGDILDSNESLYVREIISEIDMMVKNITNTGTYNGTGDPWKMLTRYPKDVPHGRACVSIELRMQEHIQNLVADNNIDGGKIYVSTLLQSNENILKDYVEFSNCLNLYNSQISKMEEQYDIMQGSYSNFRSKLATFSTDIDSVSLEDIKAHLKDVMKITEDLLLNYAMNITSKAQIAKNFGGNQTNINNVKVFVSNLTHMASEISVLIEEVLDNSGTFYTDSILGLTQLEHHLASNLVEGTFLRPMYIWKQPLVTTDVDVEISFRSDDETQVWPTSRKTSGFMRVRGKAYLSDTTEEAKKAFLDYIGKDVTVLKTLLSDLDNKRQLLSRELEEFSASIEAGEDVVLKNFLQMDVFFSALKFERVIQLKAYELPNYLSEIGGYMGLLIGASAITLIEVFDLIIFNICRKLSKERKVEPSPRSSTTTIVVSPADEKHDLYKET